MPTKRKDKVTSRSNDKIFPTSALPLHATKTLADMDSVTVRLGGEVALDAVSLCIHAGECIGLIGPNGAGKTTLLRALLGLLSPTVGHVRLLTNRIGYIPQRGSLYNGIVPMSVSEVVGLGAHHTAGNVQSALDGVHMGAYGHRRFTELSGGQQQRVVIAKALAEDAELLVMDEPTTGVDERSQELFYTIVRDLMTKGIAIVLVSHEVDTVLSLVTRVVCLNRSVLYDGLPQHFDADTYLPQVYRKHHTLLHHHHEARHA